MWGPTANLRHLACDKQAVYGACKGVLVPHLSLVRTWIQIMMITLLYSCKLRKLKGVKKVFVRSGLRFMTMCMDNNKDFVRELCEFHVSGQLKVAPEHVSKRNQHDG